MSGLRLIKLEKEFNNCRLIVLYLKVLFLRKSDFMRNLFFFALFILFSCKQSTTESCCNDQITAVQLLEAKHFRIVAEDGKQVLEIINPDSKKVVATLQPLKDNKNVIALSGTFIGMMDKLNLVDKVVGVSEIKYVYNPKVLSNFKANKVLECGYDSQMKFEEMIAMKPGLILHSGYNKEFPHQKQFENVGIQCVPIYDWREETPLGKAEWIKVYGFLFGKLDEAIKLYDGIVERYNAMKKEASNLKPSALMMSGNMIGGEWCAPAGNSYMAQLMKDANITYGNYQTEGSGSVMTTQEDNLSKNRHAAYWINPGAKNLTDLLKQNPKANLFDAFRNKQVYCYLNKDQFYWEESSIAPDKLLGDLIKIGHPEWKGIDEFYFYKRLE